VTEHEKRGITMTEHEKILEAKIERLSILLAETEDTLDRTLLRLVEVTAERDVLKRRLAAGETA